MIFSNIVFDREKLEYGQWKVLDYEWVLSFPVPIPFVIYRALYYHFRDKENGGFSYYLAKKGTDVYSLCGIDIGERMMFKEMEHSFQLYIIGGAASLDVMRRLMPSATMNVGQLVKNASYLRNLDVPKIYFSRSKAFSEDNQITIIAKADNNKISLRVPFDRYLSSIRIDPTDYPCLVHFDYACYVMSTGSKMYIDSILVNGYVISDKVYLFDTNDPQIVMYDVPQDAKSLEMYYTVTMVDKVFYDELVRLMIQKEAEQKMIKPSLTYRIKRKLGIVKEEVLPPGLQRVILQ